MPDDRRVPRTEVLVPETSVQSLEPPGSVSVVLARLREAQKAPYQSIGHLASGGMGTIEVVDDEIIGRRCALKRIHDHLANDDHAVRFFVREAQITGQLEHPNVVPVYALGEDGGTPRFTMKLVDGRTLRELIEQFPPGPLARGALLDLIEIVLKVCDALAYAHRRGVVHCDVKPDNVMVGDFGQVYLMDWGVARCVAPEGETTTPAPPDAVRDPLEASRSLAGSVAGTPSHMAPEQAAAGEVDARTDVWAVGALLYHVITRRAPYDEGSAVERVLAAREAHYPRIGEGLAPSALVAIVDRAMAFSPDDRFPSIVALRRALVRFARGEESLPIREYAAGETIVREGDPADAAYLIRHGRCEAHRMEYGRRVSLRVMGPGEMFGETAILAPGPRTASVTALEPVAVHVITAQMLESELRTTQPWLAAIVRTLAARFRERG